MRRKVSLHGVLAMLGLLGATSVAYEARADVPPPPDQKRAPFELTVRGLGAVPDQVMFAYPISASNGAPTFELWRIEDGKAVQLGRRSPTPRLYLMNAAAFSAWRDAHPETRETKDPALEALVASSSVTACSPIVTPELTLPVESRRA